MIIFLYENYVKILLILNKTRLFYLLLSIIYKTAVAYHSTLAVNRVNLSPKGLSSTP